MGWSMAWKTSVLARLRQGDHANQVLTKYFKEQSCPQLFALAGKAMQVDGTLGVPAGIHEMLLQSHLGYIDVLPALPTDWSTGKLQGARVRGGFEVDLAWNKGVAMKLLVKSLAGNTCEINAPGATGVKLNGAPISFEKVGERIRFSTEKGKRYEIVIGA